MTSPRLSELRCQPIRESAEGLPVSAAHLVARPRASRARGCARALNTRALAAGEPHRRKTEEHAERDGDGRGEGENACIGRRVEDRRNGHVREDEPANGGARPCRYKQAREASGRG